jgi:hypothetical protein
MTKGNIKNIKSIIQLFLSKLPLTIKSIKSIIQLFLSRLISITSNRNEVIRGLPLTISILINNHVSILQRMTQKQEESPGFYPQLWNSSGSNIR